MASLIFFLINQRSCKNAYRMLLHIWLGFINEKPRIDVEDDLDEENEEDEDSNDSGFGEGKQEPIYIRG